MPKKPCIQEIAPGRLCGTLSDQSRCPSHRTKGFNGLNAYARNNTSHKRFARAVLKAAGYQCQYVSKATKQRCLVTHPLQAHHLAPGNDDPAKGVALCVYHHSQVDLQARSVGRK